MHLARHVVDELMVIDNSVHRRALLHRAERLVVVTPTPAEPGASPVDGRGWHNDQVDVVDRYRAQQPAGCLRYTGETLDLGVVFADGPIQQSVLP